MATNLTETTFVSTYKDDFADSANFHKILFNSGKALQARELTQLQTILQDQISKFGNNIFKEGAVVKPGGATINQKYEFIKLNTTLNTLPTDTSTLVGTSFTGQTSGVIVKVLQVVAATGSDPDTLYVQYTNTSSGSAGTSTIRMTAGEDINNGSVTLTVQTTNTATNPATGVGILITLLSGVYYARGHFVFTEDQSKIISKYTDVANTSIGFKAVESVVSAVDNEALFDNQGAVPNLTAPGADRYKIELTIVEESEVDSDENFIHVATVKDGVIYSAVSPNDAYNVPNEVVARRIFENSGDYFVKPFTARFTLDSATTHLNLEVSPGTAVVEGFRASRDFPTTLRLSKATDTITINNDVTGTDFGNYVFVDNGTLGDSAAFGLPNINVFEKLDLKDGLDYTGSTIGTARVKAINEDGTNLRYHLFDIQMNSGQAFRNVKSIGTSTSSYFRPTLENSKAVLKETSKNTSLFALPRIRPQSLTDISFAAQRRFTATANGAGQASISLSATGETFTNTDDWIVSKADSDIFIGASISGTGSTSATLTGLPASAAVEIYGYVNKSQASIKTKTLTTRSITVGIDSDGNGQKFVPLSKADIFDVEEILKAGDSNVSYSNRFTLDDGQRDNHYALGRLLLNAGQSAPAASPGVFVKFRHFEHGVSGDFFAVNSYTGQVTYDQIPKYRFSNGTRIRLYNYLDFRSVMDSAGEFASSGTGARVIELPQPTSLVTADVTYFLPQAGKLVIDKDGIIRTVFGPSGFAATSPVKPAGTLGLYDFKLNANTLNDSDIKMTKIEHKRFTMKDIGLLEKRVDKLEEVATLSALELDTKHFQVLDSAGNDRTKSGFFVDNFLDASLSETSTTNYRAALDPLENSIRPAFTEDNIRLIYDSAASTNTIRKGDNIYIAYDEEPYINQNLATKSININPFSVVIYEGVATLSPASDEWRDVTINSERTIAGGTRLSTNSAYNWGNWAWNWGGVPVENLGIGSRTNNIGGTVNRVVSSETVLDVVEDRVIQTALLPFARSRKVFFKADGLRPNSRVFPILDGNNISDFTRSETFQFYSDYDSDFGNTLKGLTAHPDGSTNLTTDANGSISGSFIIPSNDTLKIRCGSREFKLLDISIDNEQGASIIAKASYTMLGYLDTVDRTYASTRVLNVQGYRPRDNANYDTSDNSGDGGRGQSLSRNNQAGIDGHWSVQSFGNPGVGNEVDGPSQGSSGNQGDPSGGGGGSDVGGEGGGGSGSTGGTYICTATFNANLIDFKQFRALSVYGEKLRRTDKHLMKAYDKIGPWVAKKMPKKIARKFSRAYLSAQYNNPSMFYKLITVTSRPIMRFIGRFL
tara:strand:+ start:1418 stop:5419 length:4002 start_codon:yes stop_codon:yes gene_type:complete